MSCFRTLHNKEKYKAYIVTPIDLNIAHTHTHTHTLQYRLTFDVVNRTLHTPYRHSVIIDPSKPWDIRYFSMCTQLLVFLHVYTLQSFPIKKQTDIEHCTYTLIFCPNLISCC